MFKFSKAAPQLKKKKNDDLEVNLLKHSAIIPFVNFKTGFITQLKQWWFLVKFDFKGVIKAVPFIAITLCCVLMVLSNSRDAGSLYGTQAYPVTYMILDMLTGSFILFLIIIIAFYSGELIWKEINAKLAPIIDATALSSRLILLAKFTSMILVV